MFELIFELRGIERPLGRGTEGHFLSCFHGFQEEPCSALPGKWAFCSGADLSKMR